MENNIFFDNNGKKLTLSDLFLLFPLETINRVEVIDNSGRSYTNHYPNNKVNISLQDDNRTLKIFIIMKRKTHPSERGWDVSD